MYTQANLMQDCMVYHSVVHDLKWLWPVVELWILQLPVSADQAPSYSNTKN